MDDTWAAVLGISVAVIALVQVVFLIGAAISFRRLTAAVQKTQERLDVLVTDMRLRVGEVTDRVTAVADDVRGVTARVQQVASSMSDGVQHVEQSVRHVTQRVASTMDQVPGPVRKGLPVGLAILGVLRTIQQMRSRLRTQRA